MVNTMTKKLISSLALSLVLSTASISFAEEYKKHDAEDNKKHAEMKQEDGKADHDHHEASKDAHKKAK